MASEIEKSGGFIITEGAYRYWLQCRLSDTAGKPGACLFLMLNPSTGNSEERESRHVTRENCKAFAKRRGYGTLWTCNLYAYPCRRPRELADVEDPVGPRNDEYIRKAVRRADMVVCAWGGSGWGPLGEKFADRVREVVAILEAVGADDKLYALGQSLTERGHPRHPLTFGYDPDYVRLHVRGGQLGIDSAVPRPGVTVPVPFSQTGMEPSDRRQPRKRGAAGRTDVQQARRQFWSRFLDSFREAYPEWRRDTVAKREGRSIGFRAAGARWYRYRAAFCYEIGGRPGLRAELCIKTDDVSTTNEAFDALRAGMHRKLQGQFGENLKWERLDDRKISRICLYFPGGLHVGDEAQWLRAQAWLAEALGELRDAFDPVLDKLGG